MTLTLEIALVTTWGVKRYETDLALEWLLANWFVELTPRLQIFLAEAFGWYIDDTAAAVAITGVPFLGYLDTLLSSPACEFVVVSLQTEECREKKILLWHNSR